MSDDREELHELIEQLPDEEIADVLADARRRLRPAPAASWPPAWFGSFADSKTDLGSNHEDLLAEGFGR